MRRPLELARRPIEVWCGDRDTPRAAASCTGVKRRVCYNIYRERVKASSRRCDSPSASCRPSTVVVRPRREGPHTILLRRLPNDDLLAAREPGEEPGERRLRRRGAAGSAVARQTRVSPPDARPWRGARRTRASSQSRGSRRCWTWTARRSRGLPSPSRARRTNAPRQARRSGRGTCTGPSGSGRPPTARGGRESRRSTRPSAPPLAPTGRRARAR